MSTAKNMDKAKAAKTAVKAAVSVLGSGALVGSAFILATRPGASKDANLPDQERIVYAHRGIYDNEAGIPENSIAAFELAIAEGFGIELDVRMTSDGVPIVFHDDDLDRMCGEKGKLSEKTYDEIRDLFLIGTDMRIPTLEQVLEVVNGRVPVCVEIKSSSHRPIQICKRVGDQLREYTGSLVVVSFNPFILACFRANFPNIIRGQLVTNFFKNAKKLSIFEKIGLNSLLFDCIARPNFFSFDIRCLGDPVVFFIRENYPRANMCWTVRSIEELDAALDVFEMVVMDFSSSFPLPAKGQ